MKSYYCHETNRLSPDSPPCDGCGKKCPSVEAINFGTFYCTEAGKYYQGAPPCLKCSAPCPHFKANPTKRKKAPKNRRALVFERDGYKCVNCGSTEELTIDHLKPLSKGGTNDMWNLATMCNSCNNEKGNKVYDKYLRMSNKLK